MHHLIFKLTNIGVKDSFSPKKKREYRLANSYILCAIILVLVNIGLQQYFDLNAGAITSTIALFGLSSTFIFIRNQKIIQGELLGLFFNHFAVLSSVFFYGGKFGFQLYLILVLVAYLVVFGRRFLLIRNLAIIATTSLIIGSYVFQDGFITLNKETSETARYIEYFSTFFVFASLMFFFYIAVIENRQTINRLKETAKEADLERIQKSEFLSVMSHEIRTPLNAILGITSLLHDSKDKEDFHRNLKILKTSSNQLLNLVNDILDFNKLDAGKIDLYNHEFDFQEMIENTFSLFSSKAHEKNLGYKLNYDHSINQRVIADITRLNQVISNLLSNAIKFTTTGHITLYVKKLHESKSHQRIRFEIIDTGIGIEKEQLDEIFNVFTQGGKDITRNFGGTGLGLAISRKIIELMDSQLLVESEFETGSKFFFEVDIEKATNPEVASEPKSEMAYLKGKNILLVTNDDSFNTDVLKEYNTSLNQIKFEHFSIEFISKKPYKIALIDTEAKAFEDLINPNNLRNQNSSLTEIKFIAITTNSTDRDQLINLGYDDTLHKPFHPNDLLSSLVTNLYG